MILLASQPVNSIFQVFFKYFFKCGVDPLRLTTYRLDKRCPGGKTRPPCPAEYRARIFATTVLDLDRRP
jgi:hypothetical protein